MPARVPAPMGLRLCTCGSLRAAARRLSQFYDAALSPARLTIAQYSILAEVDRSSIGDSLSMSELAVAMVMDRSTLGHNVRPLVRDELLTIRMTADDGRKRYITLTKKGEVTLNHARRLWRRAESHFEKAYGKEAAAELRTALVSIATEKQFTVHRL